MSLLCFIKFASSSSDDNVTQTFDISNFKTSVNENNWFSLSKTLPFVLLVYLLYNFVHLKLLLQVVFILLNFPPLLFL